MKMTNYRSPKVSARRTVDLDTVTGGNPFFVAGVILYMLNSDTREK